MFVLNLWFALGIALFMGLPGIPYAIWILRKSDFKKLETFVFGYVIGIIGVPLLFTIESLFNILYSPIWIPINWILMMVVGIFLLYRENMLSSQNLSQKSAALTGFISELFKNPFSLIESSFAEILLFVSMAAAFLIQLSSSGALIFELDPYYYLDGVRQIVYQGHNFANDMTAWFPLNVSNHLGQPLFKYLLAPWFSIYNGSTPYSPYTLTAIGSIYAPIMGVLTVFFSYFLFKEIYDKRAGVLAAGLAAFLPFFLIKFQGGDSQIVPYSIFALVFFISLLYVALKRRSFELTALAGVAYAALLLGSNIDIMIVFCLSLFFFGLSMSNLLAPEENPGERNKQMALLFGLMLFSQIILFLYPSISTAFSSDNFKPGLITFVQDYATIVGAFLLPLIVGYVFDKYSPSTSGLTRAFWCVILLAISVVVISQTSFFASLVHAYQDWGSYTDPLSKTIAEQAPGSPSYDGTFGFISMSFSPTDPISTAFWAITAIPTFFINWLFNSTAGFLNSALAGGNFPIIQRTNSLLGFFIFFGILFLAIQLINSLIKKEKISIYSILLLAFIVPTSFMGLEKSKLETYLGVMLIFCAVATFAELFAYLPKLIKPKDPNSKSSGFDLPTISWLVVVILILFQFGWPFAVSSNMGSAVLFTSLTPTFEQNPVAALSALNTSCQDGDQLSCSVVSNESAYLSDPVSFYDSDICASSLWPNPNVQPDSMTSQAIDYRCSFISSYWIDAMNWISLNLPTNARVTSWWDYGHWINFLGQRDTVLRNEHASHDMIGQIAVAYLDATPQQLISQMEVDGSQYAIFDQDLILSGQGLSGKYGALSYLACAYENQTSVANDPGDSQCEANNLWETVFVPQQETPCLISPITNQTGVVAYHVFEGPQNNETITPFYPGNCQDVDPNDQTDQEICSQNVHVEPAYCIGNVTLASGQSVYGTYYLNETEPNGDLVLNKATIELPASVPDTYHMGNATELTLFYTHDPIWLENGQVVSGFSDRKGDFYDSNLYNAFFLNSLPGFTLVYSTPGTGAVKIYQIDNQTVNQSQ